MRGSVDVTVRVSLGCHIRVFTLIQHSLNMNIPRQKYPLTSGPRTSATTIRSPVLRDRYFHTGIISFTLPLYCSSYSSAANAVASARYCLNIFHAFTVKNHHDKSQTAFTYSLLLGSRSASCRAVPNYNFLLESRLECNCIANYRILVKVARP